MNNVTVILLFRGVDKYRYALTLRYCRSRAFLSFAIMYGDTRYENNVKKQSDHGFKSDDDFRCHVSSGFDELV